ncbi:MAG: class B sortase [Oscillospiraceae bacterium]|nr:class B sortase [Oscillospiraceae bacterium]
MLSPAYNKRPAARGKVRESTKSTPAFIEWRQPRNFVFGFVMSLIGIVPLVFLATLNWLRIGGGYGVGAASEVMRLSIFDLIFSPIATREAMNAGVLEITGGTALGYEMAEWFSGFSAFFTGLAILFVGSVILVFASMITCRKPKARTAFAYAGFFVGLSVPIMLIVLSHVANARLDENILNFTFYPFLTGLVAIMSMVYCVRFPVLTDDSYRRNSLLTKAVTTFVPVKGDGVREGVRKVIFTSALACFIYFGSTLGVDLFNEWRAARIRARVEKAAEIMLVDLSGSEFDDIRHLEPRYYLELFSQNPDTRGFVRVGDTRVQYAIVQAEDNHFYLNRDFDGNQSRGGWPYAHFRNRFEGTELSDNTVLFGHNISTGAYFSLLSRYFSTTRNGSLSFYQENPFVQFNTLWERMEWKVFAVGLFNTEARHGFVHDYWDRIEFEDEDDFHEFILDIMDRSVLHTDADIEYGDHILTLSTCYYPLGLGRTTAESRAVIFARRLRLNESRSDFDIDAAVFNRYAYFGDFAPAARAYGSGRRRLWHSCKLLSYEGDCLACEND